MQDSHRSSSSGFRKRFLKNKSGMFGLVIILLTSLMAVLAYVIAPDHTPNADLQTIEIQAKNPGYQQQFLVIPKKQITQTNWIERFMHGTPAADDYIPIVGYKISGNTITVNGYVDDDTAVIKTYDAASITGNHPETIAQHIITRRYPLGTDGFGRDLLSRMIVGARVSIAVGLIAVLISLFIGIIVGALAGYYRGRTDHVISICINIFWSIPTLLLVFAFTIALGKGFWQVFIAIGLTMWVGVARLVRSLVIQARTMEYVQAAKTMGFSDTRIIFRHILPNIAGPIIVMATGIFASAVMIEAGLSFLGIGIQPPQPSWGGIIKENYTFLITHKPLLAIVPGLAIMLLVLSFNLLGNALRDALDVKEN